MLAGSTSSFGAGGLDLWVLKLNGDGTVAWQKTYGGAGNDCAHSIQLTSDGEYLVSGYTRSFGAGNSDVWLLKLKSDGSVDWQKTYGGTGDEAGSIQPASDGGYVLAGQSNSFGVGFADAWILKLNPDGTLVPTGMLPPPGMGIDSSARVQDSHVTGVDSTATVKDTAAIVSDTAATITDANATVCQQAPLTWSPPRR